MCLFCVCVLCVFSFVNLQEKRRLHRNCTVNISLQSKCTARANPPTGSRWIYILQADAFSIFAARPNGQAWHCENSAAQVLQRPTKNGCNSNCPHQFLLQPLLLHAHGCSLRHPSFFRLRLCCNSLRFRLCCSLGFPHCRCFGSRAVAFPVFVPALFPSPVTDRFGPPALSAPATELA